MNTLSRAARLTFVLAGIIFLALTGVSSLSAQERFVQIQGTATDPSGASVPKANVTVTNAESGRVYTGLAVIVCRADYVTWAGFFIARGDHGNGRISSVTTRRSRQGRADKARPPRERHAPACAERFEPDLYSVESE